MKKITDFLAVIWDFDGVIVDSEKLWSKNAPDFYRIVCPTFDHRDMHRFVGGSLNNAWKIFREKYDITISYDDFKVSCEDFALKRVYPEVKLSPYVKECFIQLRKHNIPQAIASSGTHRWIDPTIERLRIRDFFEAIVSSDDTGGRGKPFPDVFLLAAETLKQNPAKLLIIEDSHNGVIAGKKTGATVYGYRNGYNDAQDLSPADYQFADFRNIV